MKLHTCKGGLNSTEHYNRTCKANKRNATTKNGFSSPPLISGYKVASLYLIPTINNKGIKQKRNEGNKFGDTYKTISPNPADRFVSDACFMTLESSLKTKRLCIFSDTPGSGYLFSCFILMQIGAK